MVAIAIFACGFSLAPTPEEIKAQERAAAKWAQTVRSHYDLAALTSFLKKTVAEKKCWRDVELTVDLTKPKIDDKWIAGDTCTDDGKGMTSGDWYFSATNPKADKFTLWFYYAKGDRILILNCIRKTKDNFELLEITSEGAPLTIAYLKNQASEGVISG